MGHLCSLSLEVCKSHCHGHCTFRLQFSQLFSQLVLQYSCMSNSHGELSTNKLVPGIVRLSLYPPRTFRGWYYLNLCFKVNVKCSFSGCSPALGSGNWMVGGAANPLLLPGRVQRPYWEKYFSVPYGLLCECPAAALEGQASSSG